MIAVRMTEVREAIRKSLEYFPQWSRKQRHAWVRGHLHARTLAKAPISSLAPRVPTMFRRSI